MKIFSVLLGLLLTSVISAQPFICDGTFYLVITNNNTSVFYSVSTDVQTGSILFNALPTSNNFSVNAIGYRSTDNYIYGLRSNNLYRVGASGMAVLVAPLPDLDPTLFYFAGDVSPDGLYLYVLGIEGSLDITTTLSRINLEDYSVETIAIPEAEEAGIYCADFSVDPLDGSLYGFDREERRMLKIDALTGTFNENLFPATDVAKTMGAVFFDAFGNLYGYGEHTDPGIANTFFKIDKSTGVISAEANGPPANGTDGCSCPYRVRLNKTVSPSIIGVCDTTTYTFTISNLSSDTLTQVNFQDIFPDDLFLKEIIRNPFGGTITSGVGGSEFLIENMVIPKGIDSIIISVEVDPLAEGLYTNQALLYNLPPGLGSSTLSDDPNTIFFGDSTKLSVQRLSANFTSDTIVICKGESWTYTFADLPPNTEVSWENGSSQMSRTFEEQGWYWVYLSNECEMAVDSFYLLLNELSVDLGADLEIALGDSLVLDANLPEEVTYQWEDPLGNTLSCLDCPNPVSRPFFDIIYSLKITDDSGCMASDDLKVKVLKERKIFIPNVFTPNFDGYNDLLYIHGSGYGNIQSFKIFNRWGAVVFESKNGWINDPAFGWDGYFKEEKANEGVYVYYTEIEFLDGLVEAFSGTITLVR